MSKLSGTLHINSNLKNEAEAGDGYIGLSSNILSERLKSADHASFISAYYDIDFLKSLKYPKNSLTSLTMVFSRLAGSAIKSQTDELQGLKESLQKATGRNTSVSVMIASRNRTLHTKLYHFRRGKWARSLIGSANATYSGFYRNDEILIEIQGRDTVIEDYISYTIEKATSCYDEVPDDNEYDSFQSLLRDGYVYFKASRPVPYTVSCFDNAPLVAETLQKSVATAPLQFHEGLSVGLLNILKLAQIEVSGKTMTQDEDRQRVPLNRYAIETCFGYWVPVPYYKEVEERIRVGAQRKAKLLSEVGARLNRLSASDLAGQINEVYLADIDRRLEAQAARKLTPDQRKAVEDKILRRAASLKIKLSDERERDRLARSISSVPVPEVWEDPHSTREMMDSFCECLAWKLEQSAKLSKVVGKLKALFSLERGDSPEDIRERIDTYFNTKTMFRSKWT